MKNERGQGLLEFALILVLVAFIAIACFVVFAPQIQTVWERISTIASAITKLHLMNDTLLVMRKDL